MRTIWSVEIEETGWTDDTFCGTYEECVKYCIDDPDRTYYDEDCRYYVLNDKTRICELYVDDDYIEMGVKSCIEPQSEIWLDDYVRREVK